MITKKRSTVIINIIMAMITLLFLSPFYIPFSYAFKTPLEIALSPLSFPTSFSFDNFIEAFEKANFSTVFSNTVIATIFSVMLSVTVCTMAAYIIERKNNKFYNRILYLFMAALMLPFQTVMFPLYSQFKTFGLLNSLLGLIIAFAGFKIGFSTFLISRFVKTVPIELEEAAIIDGAGRYTLFFRIVVPLLKPIIMTSVVMGALGAWNEFMIPLVLATNQKVHTLAVSQYYFIGQYSMQVNVAFAYILASMIPILALYFLLQKYIVDGVTAGAVKS